MILTRRGFFRAMVPAAIAAPLVLEELLHPGRVFFLPPRARPDYYTIDWAIDWAKEESSRIAATIDERLLRRFAVVETRWADVLAGRFVPLDELVQLV